MDLLFSIKESDYASADEVLHEYDYSNMPNGFLKNKLLVRSEKYNKDIFKKKVGIVTTHLHSNFGGVLQAYALQRVIKNLGYSCTTLG